MEINNEQKKYDYEKIIKSLLQKNITQGSYADIKDCEESDYISRMEILWSNKIKLTAEKLRLANIETEINNFNMLNSGDYYEPTKQIAIAEKRINELNLEEQALLNHYAGEINKLTDHYDEKINFYTDETLEKLTLNNLELQNIHMGNIKKLKEKLELTVTSGMNLEIPELDGVFDEEFKYKFSDAEFEIKRKKCNELCAKVEELKTKIDAIQ